MSKKTATIDQLRMTAEEARKLAGEVASAAAEDMEALMNSIHAVQTAVEEAKRATEKLRQDILDGTITVKPVFPVVSADPADAAQGEAWILADKT